MKRLLLVLLLAGCAHKEPVVRSPQATNTTVYRYASSPQTCTAPAVGDSAELRRVTKSRDDWKRYAEGLELLTPKDTAHAPNP